MKINELDKAYLAGIIDGEGWITVHKTKGRYYYLYLGVKMTTTEALELLSSASGKDMQKYHWGKPSNSPTYQVMLYGKEVQQLLELLFPYLRVKRRQATLALAFPLGNGYKKPVSVSCRESQKVIYKEIKQLNKRGREL